MEFTHFHYESVTSTMNIVRDYMEKNPNQSHGYLVSSATQSAGRGRYGRQWISPKGNLLFSFCLVPPVSLSKASELSFVICLAIGELLQEILPKRSKMMYKWPNDILVDDKKISGILLEAITNKDNQFAGLIVGIGINCQHFPPLEALTFPQLAATSLLDRGCKMEDIDPRVILEKLKPKLSFFYEHWLKNGFTQMRNLWIERAKGKNEWITVRLHSEDINGIFKDIDAQGALILETEKEVITITAGDVFFKN